MKKNKTTLPNLDMRKVSKEIIEMKFKNTDTLGQCRNKFYEIMRKNGIKKGTQTFNPDGTKGGITQNNFEWTMCEKLFEDRIISYFLWSGLLTATPKDLMAY